MHMHAWMDECRLLALYGDNTIYGTYDQLSLQIIGVCWHAYIHIYACTVHQSHEGHAVNHTQPASLPL